MTKLTCNTNNRATFTKGNEYELKRSASGNPYVKDDRGNHWFLMELFGGSQYHVKGGNKKLFTTFLRVEPSTRKREILWSAAFASAIVVVAALAYALS